MRAATIPARSSMTTLSNMRTMHATQARDAKSASSALCAMRAVAFDLGIKTLATGYNDQGRVYKRVAEKKRRKQRDCLHKASHLIAGSLAERAVVIGDLSPRQIVMKKQENETPKERRKRQIRNRLLYNDWSLYSFLQILEYKCLRFGTEQFIIDVRD